jgi:hypothetical protein
MHLRKASYIAPAAFCVFTLVAAATSSVAVPKSETKITKEENIHSPRLGTKERTAILRALRKPVAKSLGKNTRFLFSGVKLRVGDRWAYIDAVTVDRQGRSVGPDFTNELAALLRQENGKWYVVEWAYATDVISMAWEEKHEDVPTRLWPHRR